MVEANTARRIDERVFVQRDRRADGGARRIRVTREDVLISRRFSGVSMVISVPVTAYCGVALEVQPADDGSPRYVLSLAHRDPDLDILLGETQDCGAAASDWRHWAAWLGLPRVTEEDGALRSREASAKRSPPPSRAGAARPVWASVVHDFSFAARPATPAAPRSCMAQSARSFLMNEASPARPTRQGRSSRSLRGFPAP